MVNEELIALDRALVEAAIDTYEGEWGEANSPDAWPNRMKAALESRPAPTEEMIAQARRILTEEALATGEFASINTTSEGSWNPWPIAIRAMLRFAAGGELLDAAVNQNDVMRQELAHVGNLVSDLARALRVDQANDDGTWPDLAGRIHKLIEAAPKPTTPERAKAMEEAIRDYLDASDAGDQDGMECAEANMRAVIEDKEPLYALSASPPEVGEK